MALKLSFHKAHLESFLESAVERHKIYLKRKAGEDKPWTDNEVFQKYFFCNVFRQYDKCSKWIIENILPFERWDLIILYRFISTLVIFQEIEANCELNDIAEIKYFLADKYRRGDKLFSSCFIRNPNTSQGTVSTYKAVFILLQDIKYNGGLQDALSVGTLEHLVNWIKQFKGVAGFMGYEYACDFEYTKQFNPTDKYTWTNKGPGAERGLGLVVKGSSTYKFSQELFLKYARELFVLMRLRFTKEFPNEDLTMREVEHWLCEYQKYNKYRVSMITGNKVKYRKYSGGF